MQLSLHTPHVSGQISLASLPEPTGQRIAASCGLDCNQTHSWLAAWEGTQNVPYLESSQSSYVGTFNGLGVTARVGFGVGGRVGRDVVGAKVSPRAGFGVSGVGRFGVGASDGFGVGASDSFGVGAGDGFGVGVDGTQDKLSVITEI
jgi:hypothetical protein